MEKNGRMEMGDKREMVRKGTKEEKKIRRRRRERGKKEKSFHTNN